MVSTAARARARGPAAAAPPQAQQHEEGGQEEGGDIEEDGMTEIERQRLANIQRNAEVLLQAGLGGGQSLLGRRKQGPGAGTAGDEARRRKKVCGGLGGLVSIVLVCVYVRERAHLIDPLYSSHPNKTFLAGRRPAQAPATGANAPLLAESGQGGA